MLKDFTKEAFDIFIQAGQSNSEGYGFGDIENPYKPCEQVYYLTNEFIIERAREQLTENKAQSNFGLPFVREYIEKGMLSNCLRLSHLPFRLCCRCLRQKKADCRSFHSLCNGIHSFCSGHQ